jgi:DNA-binding NarL/FixJ family response regulator
MAIRVLITDDHGLVRQGPRMFLSLDPDIEVVGASTQEFGEDLW